MSDSRPTITAHIVVRDAGRAAEWYADAFGAVEENRIAVPDGRFLEIALRIGNSPLLLCDEFAEMGVLSPLSVGGPTAPSTSQPTTWTCCGRGRSRRAPRCTTRFRMRSGASAPVR